MKALAGGQQIRSKQRAHLKQACHLGSPVHSLWGTLASTQVRDDDPEINLFRLRNGCRHIKMLMSTERKQCSFMGSEALQADIGGRAPPWCKACTGSKPLVGLPVSVHKTCTVNTWCLSKPLVGLPVSVHAGWVATPPQADTPSPPPCSQTHAINQCKAAHTTLWAPVVDAGPLLGCLPHSPCLPYTLRSCQVHQEKGGLGDTARGSLGV
eukprot:1125384-Pelagomonas_calceolata.AAC.2